MTVEKVTSMPTDIKTAACRFEIRKDNQPYAGWNDPKLTPSKETLRSMKAAGYRLYVDGKLQR